MSSVSASQPGQSGAAMVQLGWPSSGKCFRTMERTTQRGKSQVMARNSGCAAMGGQTLAPHALANSWLLCLHGGCGILSDCATLPFPDIVQMTRSLARCQHSNGTVDRAVKILLLHFLSAVLSLVEGAALMGGPGWHHWVKLSRVYWAMLWVVASTSSGVLVQPCHGSLFQVPCCGCCCQAEAVTHSCPRR
jgi:hypothetical protein